MIYPPINKLVEKTGNKYKLVIATAKRARVIANAEKAKEKPPVEVNAFIAAKNAAKGDKNIQKPIVKAINDIVDGKVYVLKAGEGYKSEGFESITAIEEALAEETTEE
ncbi:MAG: DNA-directed RNA polymerase subunit omega [Clostridia bacterium]|nr:DNA-directed RNA polymerase subunit omega [Clostridia bacterium]